MKTRPELKTNPADVPEFTFVLGRVHDKIGGPTRTIWGYVEGLEGDGVITRIVGLGSSADMETSFAEARASSLLGLDGGRWAQLKGLYRLYQGQHEGATLAVVGVWHLAFFAIGLFTTVRRLTGRTPPVPVILIPTMSLTDYDWSKRRRIKTLIRPLVSLILKRIDGVIFASTGEHDESSPATWERAEIILHPSVSISSSFVKMELPRDIDILFVGRIAPQKDIPLLFRSLTSLPPGATLHIVGDGHRDYVNEMKSEAERLGVASRVIWHGWKSHEETLKFFGRARVVAVTSLVENYCHAAVEALVAEADLVLVNRVMSAPDFAGLADIDVTEPKPELFASALLHRLKTWDARADNRKASASAIRQACSPDGAARRLREFISSPRINV